MTWNITMKPVGICECGFRCIEHGDMFDASLCMKAHLAFCEQGQHIERLAEIVEHVQRGRAPQ